MTEKVRIPMPTEEERIQIFQEHVKSYHAKLTELAQQMAGRILWRREPVRGVAMSKRDIFRILHGERNRAAFQEAWKVVLPEFQEVAVERSRGHKLGLRYVPKGVLGPIKGAANAVFFEDGKHDTAHPLDCVPRPEDLIPLPPLPPVPDYMLGSLGEQLIGAGFMTKK